MNIYEQMDQALALVPTTYPRRSELASEINEFHIQSPEAEPTQGEVLECFEYYLGSMTTVAWKKKIAEILKG